MSELIHNHYQKLAGIFEYLWFYSEDFVQFLTKNILNIYVYEIRIYL